MIPGLSSAIVMDVLAENHREFELIHVPIHRIIMGKRIDQAM